MSTSKIDPLLLSLIWLSGLVVLRILEPWGLLELIYISFLTEQILTFFYLDFLKLVVFRYSYWSILHSWVVFVIPRFQHLSQVLIISLLLRVNLCGSECWAKHDLNECEHFQITKSRCFWLSWAANILRSGANLVLLFFVHSPIFERSIYLCFF